MIGAIRKGSDILHVGCDDVDIDLFESQYVVPDGMAYNSYVILDDKVAIIDTVDQRVRSQWRGNLSSVLGSRQPDFLVVQHLEPDHSADIEYVLSEFPSCKVVLSDKASKMLPQFADGVSSERVVAVREGDKLELGHHVLNFVMAPMVHWPEVMVSFDSATGTLFSADAFGKFGALCNESDDWACEARRYYFNICGKYGNPVQTLLKKASKLPVSTICPLHGPLLLDNLDYYLGLYDTWSSYRAESDGVFIAYGSMHGNTRQAAELLADELRKRGVKVAISDLSRSDIAECVEDAFRYDRMVLCAPSYDAGVMPVMRDFLEHLSDKAFQNRTVALVENGSWAPSAARTMRKLLDGMKNISVLDPVVTILTRVSPEAEAALSSLAQALVK